MDFSDKLLKYVETLSRSSKPTMPLRFIKCDKIHYFLFLVNTTMKALHLQHAGTGS